MPQWSWKSDLRTKDSAEGSWTPYSKSDNTKIEKAYKAKQKSMKLNAKHSICFNNMLQHHTGDYDRQRAIRREADSDSESDQPARRASPKKTVAKKKKPTKAPPGVKWFWKSDLRKKDTRKECWTAYAMKDVARIEAAYQSKKTGSFSLTKRHTLDFKAMVQHRSDDYERQRDIKRVGPTPGSDDDDDDDDDEAPAMIIKKRGRTTSEGDDTSEAKRQRTATGVAKRGKNADDDDDDSDDDEKPTKSKRGVPARGKVKADDDDDDDDDSGEEKPKKKRGTGAAADKGDDGDDDDDDDDGDGDKETEKKGMKLVRQMGVGQHRRSTWIPTVKKGSRASPAQSKFGGQPYLRSEDNIPVCGDCDHEMAFLVQVNFSEVPSGAQKIYGKSGLLQVFMCPDDCDSYEPFSKCSSVRILPGDELEGAGKTVPAPTEEEWIQPELPIIAWVEKPDYPSTMELTDELDFEEKDDEVMDEWSDCFPHCKSKLGGWPTWVQGVEYVQCPTCNTTMNESVFNFESDDNINWCIGDCGTCQVMRCPNHKDKYAVGWACG